MSKLLSHISVVLNGWLTGDTGRPLCYTAYERKSKWYRFFDTAMFWDKQHCRKVWLSRRIHEQPKIIFAICRDDYKTDFEWDEARNQIETAMSKPCMDGYHWVKEEQFRWSMPPDTVKNWKIRLLAVRNINEQQCDKEIG